MQSLLLVCLLFIQPNAFASQDVSASAEAKSAKSNPRAKETKMKKPNQSDKKRKKPESKKAKVDRKIKQNIRRGELSSGVQIYGGPIIDSQTKAQYIPFSFGAHFQKIFSPSYGSVGLSYDSYKKNVPLEYKAKGSLGQDISLKSQFSLRLQEVKIHYKNSIFLPSSSMPLLAGSLFVGATESYLTIPGEMRELTGTKEENKSVLTTAGLQLDLPFAISPTASLNFDLKGQVSSSNEAEIQSLSSQVQMNLITLEKRSKNQSFNLVPFIYAGYSYRMINWKVKSLEGTVPMKLGIHESPIGIGFSVPFW
jgi:hypothetical protein